VQLNKMRFPLRLEIGNRSRDIGYLVIVEVVGMSIC
jgi:hypothetical protein